MDTVTIINITLAALFFVCYAYQLFYIIVPFFAKDKPHGEIKKHRFAVLIAARNEEKVIGQLINSITNQTYDRDLVTVFVVADNCDDATAAVAADGGAVVYKRFDKNLIGKGYALNFLLRKIAADYPEDAFDGYFVFDADNVLDENYILEMNKTFSDGYEVITSYRNSKNFGTNWITAGYALWFLRESRYLNHSRMLLGTSCAVSGTGFMFSQAIINEYGGWNFFLLTEDIEFTVHNVCSGKKIGFCKDAVLFDEQPETFGQSWTQRLRWARGYLQVFGKYGAKLAGGAIKGSFSCFDMTMAIMPAAVISVIGIIANIYAIIFDVAVKNTETMFSNPAFTLFYSMYLTVFIVGAITTASEWKSIYAPAWKKLLYTFTFPLFMLTYIPIMFAAMMHKRITWKPIEHTRNEDISDIRCEDTSQISKNQTNRSKVLT